MKYNKSMAQILAEMNKVKKEQEGEGPQDPIDQAKKKIDKIKKIAVLKKQMADIQKSEDLDKKDEPTVKKVVKMLKKASDAHAGQAKDLEKDLKDETDLEEARWEIEGRMSYRGIRSEDSFHMVIDAPNERAAEQKAYKELDKARAKKKIGPGGGGSVEDVEIEGIERTTNKLSPPESGPMMNSYDPELKEFTSSQIERLRKEYESLRGKETGINPEKFKKLRGMMKRFPKANLLKLVKADIPVLTTGAKAALVMYHGMKWSQLPEDFLPYIDIFADDTLDEQKGKFKEVDPKVIDRIEKMMRGSRQEKDSIANMLNYFMPPEVVDMVRYKLKIVPKRGKIKF